MTLKERILEYCKQNNIAITVFSKELGFHMNYLCTKRRAKEIFTLRSLGVLDSLFRDTKEFREEVACRIKGLIRTQIVSIDREAISDDDCLKIFDILKKYIKGGKNENN